MIKSNCKQCGKEVVRPGSRAAVFCGIECKAEHQRGQKPVSKEWLYQKYVNEGLGTVEISKLVDRHPRRVYEWLIDLEIPIRKRKWGIKRDVENKPYQSKEWLFDQYVNQEKSVPAIAEEQGVSVGCIMHFMRKFDIARRTIKEVREIQYWGLSGEDNPMYGVTGEENANWKGGTTPERQKLYNSQEWANVVSIVWERDDKTCQRCGDRYLWGQTVFHIHHIVPFSESVELRSDPDNLLLVCRECHLWIHSNSNKNQEFIERK